MKPIAYILLAALGALAWFLWHRFGNSKHNRLFKRIDRIKQRRVGAAKPSGEMSLRRKTDATKGIIYWITKPLPDSKWLGDLLERAGKTITPKQYLFRVLLAWLAITIIVTMLKKSLLIGLIAGAVLAGWLPLKFVKRSISKHQKAFLRLFPDAIDLIVRGLRSGLPVSESMIMVGQEVPDPVGSVFTNIANTMKLGVTMEKALQESAQKLDMTEFNFFTTSIILQRETGGNLSEILNNLSEVLRSRYIMRMKIKALSSEARASSYIIGALPFVVILAVSVLSPKYIAVLYTDPRGNMCAGVAAFMMIFGMWTMNRMTKFEI